MIFITTTSLQVTGKYYTFTPFISFYQYCICDIAGSDCLFCNQKPMENFSDIMHCYELNCSITTGDQ